MQARAAYDEGEHNATHLVELVRSTIEAQPLARIDYVSLNDAENLQQLDRLDRGTARPAFAGGVFGKTRLIDNVVLEKTKTHDAAGANA